MSFDSVAPWYRALETIAFGNTLQRARTACLGEMSSPRRALVVGEGNGRFLAALLQRHALLKVDCVDGSARMLGLARRRILETIPDEIRRVEFLHRDVLSWTPEDRYDLIVTHFLLDCFRTRHVGLIVAKLAQVAAPNACWLLADFRIPETGFARIHARAWIFVMYSFFRCVAGIESQELIDPSPFLRAEKFTLARQDLFRLGMVKSQLWRRQL